MECHWDQQAQDTLEKIKYAHTNHPGLIAPNWANTFRVHMDASDMLLKWPWVHVTQLAR